MEEENISTAEEMPKTRAPRKKKTIILVIIAIVVLGLAIAIIYDNSEPKVLKDLAQQYVTEKCIFLTGGEARDVKTEITTIMTQGETTYILKGTYEFKDPYGQKLSGYFHMELEKLGDHHNWEIIDVTVLAPGL